MVDSDHYVCLDGKSTFLHTSAFMYEKRIFFGPTILNGRNLMRFVL